MTHRSAGFFKPTVTSTTCSLSYIKYMLLKGSDTVTNIQKECYALLRYYVTINTRKVGLQGGQVQSLSIYRNDKMRED